MYINHRHYILLLMAIITVVFSVVGYVFFYRLIVSQAVESSQVLADESDMNKKRQYEKQLSADYEKFSDDRDRVSVYIVSQEKIVDFIEVVEKIGASAGVKIDLSAINEEDGHIKSHAIAQGSWKNIMQVLILLENIPYSVSLNNIQLSKSSESAKTSLWDMSLDIRMLTIK